MTPQQYRNALKRLGFSIVGAGPHLGVTGRTSQRYANGESPIPERTIMLIEHMLKASEKPDTGSRRGA
jgi:hypothetical protein